jgi:hypothetical protein
MRLLITLLSLLSIALFSGCETERVEAKDRMLGKEKRVTFQIDRISRSTKKYASPTPVKYFIKGWRKVKNGWNPVFGGETPESMELLDSRFVKSISLLYGYHYKLEVIGVDRHGKVIYNNPDILFKVDERDTINISLYRSYSEIYALDIYDLKTELHDDNRSFSFEPRIVFPFSEIDDFEISLERVFSGEIEFEETIEADNLSSEYSYKVKKGSDIEIKEENSSLNRFLFSVNSPYMDISNYGELFSIKTKVDENGESIVEAEEISLVNNFYIQQSSETVEIAIFFPQLEGIKVSIDISDVEPVEESLSVAIFRFSPFEVPNGKFRFRLRGELDSGSEFTKTHFAYFNNYIDEEPQQ